MAIAEGLEIVAVRVVLTAADLAVVVVRVVRVVLTAADLAVAAAAAAEVVAVAAEATTSPRRNAVVAAVVLEVQEVEVPEAREDLGISGTPAVAVFRMAEIEAVAAAGLAVLVGMVSLKAATRGVAADLGTLAITKTVRSLRKPTRPHSIRALSMSLRRPQ